VFIPIQAIAGLPSRNRREHGLVLIKAITGIGTVASG